LHTAALSQNIGKEPVGVEMLSEKIVLFRNSENKVVAINDVCPHRGAPLHKGALDMPSAKLHSCSHVYNCNADAYPGAWLASV
jgi:nitrite reductase/ring-hydroxylating ferredoxin subunit